MIIHFIANFPEEYEVSVSELEGGLKKHGESSKYWGSLVETKSTFDRIMKYNREKYEEKALFAFKKDQSYM